ncbi:phage tail protein [Streptomyces sp. NPDC048330]|uniref:phage tail tube protein n=1 Tax=Streptomyces sp. NPDC048330 TaxID=3365533 RepID=UPI0037205F6C
MAPPKATLPTDSESTWNATFTDIGWISDDGITESNSADSSEIKGWQGGQTVRKVISSSEMTFSFTAIETSKTVLELYHKGSKVVTTSGKSVLAVKAPGPDRRTFGFDVIDGDSHIRIVIPDGEVTETGDITYKGDEAIAYELTITAYPGSDGTVALKYSNDPAWSAAPPA